MRELSLFSGAGGGLLGTHCLMGWRTIGYVEINDYCQRIIAQRIRDGYLDEAPIFGDIKTFISDGYAMAYSKVVDVLTAGFPCQPFTVAGRQRAEKDERNLWPETREVIRLVRPRYVLLENVPGLLVQPYFGTILHELAESGYCVRWRCLSAAEVGAPHRRDRVWIVGSRLSNASENGRNWADEPKCQRKEMGRREQFGGNGKNGDVADAEKTGIKPAQQPRQRDGIVKSREHVENSTKSRLERATRRGIQGQNNGFARTSKRTWWTEDPAEGPTESRLGRVAHGVAHRVDRLKAIGEGQVPAVVATVWQLLMTG